MHTALGWVRVAFAMFAVGWGANQFSTMLIVYRHALGLSPAAVAGLFAVYGATLIPALLVGGPASDRYGRRAVVLPSVALSPLGTTLAHSFWGSGPQPQKEWGCEAQPQYARRAGGDLVARRVHGDS